MASLPPPPPRNVVLVILRFQTDYKSGNLKQRHINETNCFFCCCLAVGYLNKRNVVAFETDSPNPVPTCCPPGSWPDHYWGLELCSSYLCLATRVVHHTAPSQIPFSVLAKVTFVWFLTSPVNTCTSKTLKLRPM